MSKRYFACVYGGANEGIARQHKEKGECVDDWFYTKGEFNEIKKNPENRIIK